MRIAILALLCWVSLGVAANASVLVPNRCQALMAGFLVDDLGGPDRHFMYSHNLTNVLQRNQPPILTSFFAQRLLGECVFNCESPEARLNAEFTGTGGSRGQFYRLRGADYLHTMAGLDPIFGEYKIVLQEKTSQPYAAEGSTVQNFEEAEDEVRGLLRKFLRPATLDQIAKYLKLKYHEQPHDELDLSDFQHQAPEERGWTEYVGDAHGFLLRVGSARSRAELLFSYGAAKIVNMMIRTQVGVAAVEADLQFDNGDLIQVTEAYEREMSIQQVAQAQAEQEKITRGLAEQALSQGHYVRMPNPTDKYPNMPPGSHLAFVLSSGVLPPADGLLKFRMADFPRPSELIVGDQRFFITYMRDGIITFLEDGPAQGGYMKVKVEHQGLTLNMIDVVLRL